MANKVHVKTGDIVIVLTGDYKDKKDKNGNRVIAKVLEVSPKEGKVIVEGVNTATKHVKARKQGDQSGIVKVDAPIYACKVQLYCKNCDAGRRAKHVLTVDEKTGKTIKTRVCAKCGKEI